VRVAPRSRATDGDDAAFLSNAYGLTPDEWQTLVVDDWLATRRDGKWASSRCGLSVPRQNGKNGALEVVELYKMVMLGRRILHTAHEVKTARKAFLRLTSFFENERKYPELAALVADIRRTNGQEAIVLANGGSCEFIARSKGSGRGFTVDDLVLDEAQELDDFAYAALLPTISAAPSGNPQQIVTGTPPGSRDNGEVFTRLRDDALSGKSTRTSWLEWSADVTPDLDDRGQWAKSNPALGVRLDLETVADERAAMDDATFARERLGMWAPARRSSAVVPANVWNDLKASDPPAQDVPPSALAADMSHGRVVAIAGCWLDEDRPYVELLALDAVDDTTDAVSWLAKRAGRRIPVVIDADSPAASMVPELKALKVKVIVAAVPDVGKACGGWLDDVLERRLTHAGQSQVDDALAMAKKRLVGNAGRWVWDGSDPTKNVAPLRAVTLARYGAVVTKKRARSSANSGKVVVLS
jgi:hypothetical protein